MVFIIILIKVNFQGSEAQQAARKCIEEVAADLRQQPSQAREELVNYYNTHYHNSPDKEKKEMAWKIRTRIRFLHLTGVLLRKKMIDEDLLFSLIGLGFEIDHPQRAVIVAAHRKDHNTPS